MLLVNLPTAQMWLLGDLVHTVLPDDSMVELDLRQVYNKWYTSIARMMGYEDPRIYAIHHDATHNWLAWRLDKSWSVALWQAARGLPETKESEEEEYLVNTLQWVYNNPLEGETHHKHYLPKALGPNWKKVVLEHKMFLQGLTSNL